MTEEYADTSMPPREVGVAALRALKTVALSDGQYGPLETDLLESMQQHILGTTEDLDALEPIGGEELAARVPEGPYRSRILDGALIVAMIDGEVSPKEAEALDALSAALHIESKAHRDVAKLAEGSVLAIRFDVIRRGFQGQKIAEFVQERGFAGVKGIGKALLGIADEKVAARYRKLSGLPEGSLGRAYYEFMTTNQFSFPGEKEGAPEAIVFHDCLHVLGEFGTDPRGEMEVVAFQAGNIRQDPIFSFFFGLLQFQLGVRLSPVTGALSKQLLEPGRLVRAHARGRQVNRPMCTEWDPWDDFDRQIDDLRRDYNILLDAP